MLKTKDNNKLKGFSLFELLVTIGILLIMSLIVFPITLQKVDATKLESHVSQLVTDIYFQQQESFFKNTPKGIVLENNRYALFDGENLSTATEIYYKNYPRNIYIQSISFPIGNEITFPAGELKPSDPGTLIMTDGFNQIRIYINKEGLIDYEFI